MKTRRRIPAITLVAALAPLSAGWAVNMVGNGEFDLDTLGWEYSGNGPVPDWVTIDHDSCGNASGSARAENAVAAADFTIVYITCVTGVEPGPYSLDGFVRFPPGQDRTGAVAIGVTFRDAVLDCVGPNLANYFTGELQTSNPDVWVHRALRDLIAPPTATSAAVYVSVRKVEAGGALQANFDGIHLVRGNGYLFGDDFESDTRCRWSLEAP